MDPHSIADALDRTVRDGGHEYTIGTRTVNDVPDQSLAQERLMAILAASFAVLGLALAAIGIHGLLRYSIAHRTPEIGLRIALGANRAQIVRLVLGNAMALVLTGVLLGGPAGWAANKTVAALIYRRASFGVFPTSLAVVVLILTSLVAAWFPVRRAVRVNPLAAIRAD